MPSSPPSSRLRLCLPSIYALLSLFPLPSLHVVLMRRAFSIFSVCFPLFFVCYHRSCIYLFLHPHLSTCVCVCRSPSLPLFGVSTLCSIDRACHHHRRLHFILAPSILPLHSIPLSSAHNNTVVSDCCFTRDGSQGIEQGSAVAASFHPDAQHAATVFFTSLLIQYQRHATVSDGMCMLFVFDVRVIGADMIAVRIVVIIAFATVHSYLTSVCRSSMTICCRDWYSFVC